MKPILESLGLVTQGDESSWAVTSPDNQYRYVLGRMWDAYFSDDPWECCRPLWAFCMLNPSKARHDVADPTIRKCIGFAKRGGAGGVMVVNLLAYSATHPQNMVAAYRAGVDVRGEHNEAVVQWAASRPAFMGMNVAAWGNVPPKLRGLAAGCELIFRSRGCHCFGVNSGGSPKHPLMLGYDTALIKL